jgi:transcriptional regulator with XRE-family HTH domain
MSIGSRVRRLREAQGLSLRALARSSGMTPTGVSLVEQGKSTPTSTTIEKLSRALGVEPGVLFGEPISKTPPPQTMEELLEAAGVEGRELARSYSKDSPDYVGELFEGLSYEEVQELAWRIINARRAVKATIERYLKDPDITPEEVRKLELLGLHTMQVSMIAILSATEAADAEIARTNEAGDTTHADAFERDKRLLLAQVGG